MTNTSLTTMSQVTFKIDQLRTRMQSAQKSALLGGTREKAGDLDRSTNTMLKLAAELRERGWPRRLETLRQPHGVDCPRQAASAEGRTCRDGPQPMALRGCGSAGSVFEPPSRQTAFHPTGGPPVFEGVLLDPDPARFRHPGLRPHQPPAGQPDEQGPDNRMGQIVGDASGSHAEKVADGREIGGQQEEQEHPPRMAQQKVDQRGRDEHGRAFQMMLMG